MSGQKTEKPTPKRLRDARKKGQVANSRDFTQAFLLLGAGLVLSYGGGAYLDQVQEVMKNLFRPETLTGDLTTEQVLAYSAEAAGSLFVMMLPLPVSLFVIAGAVQLFQVRPLFAPEVIKPKPEKLNPVKGFQNIFFKSKTYLELAKSVVKFGVIFTVIFLVLRGALDEIILSPTRPFLDTAVLAADLLFTILWRVAIAFVALGVADFFLQKHLHMKELKMSQYEVRKEYKEQEGDPQIKQARRSAHEEILSENMMQSVPESDVVVVNPTRLAVALSYREAEMGAPRITAKGQNVIAARIRELAQDAGVPIMRNVGLTQSLYELQLGTEIPEDLYEAVAEVLNWVYKLRQEAEEGARR